MPTRTNDPIQDLTKRGWVPVEQDSPDTKQWISFHEAFWGQDKYDLAVDEIVDMSAWYSALRVLRRTHFRLLVRQEYHDFYAALTEASQRPSSSRVITGSPGIGKTVFLIYMLIRRLTQAQPTILALSTFPMLFHSTGTYFLCNIDPRYHPLYVDKSTLPQNRPWILLDTPAEPKPPSEVLRHTDLGFPILTTSPDERRYKLLLKEGPDCCLWIMQVWDEKELLAVVRPLLPPHPKAEVMIKSIIDDFGFCIRDVAQGIQGEDRIRNDRIFIVRRSGSIRDLPKDKSHQYMVDDKSRMILEEEPVNTALQPTMA